MHTYIYINLNYSYYIDCHSVAIWKVVVESREREKEIFKFSFSLIFLFAISLVRAQRLLVSIIWWNLMLFWSLGRVHLSRTTYPWLWQFLFFCSSSLQFSFKIVISELVNPPLRLIPNWWVPNKIVNYFVYVLTNLLNNFFILNLINLPTPVEVW